MNTDDKIPTRRSSVFSGGLQSCSSKEAVGLPTGFASLDRALGAGGLPRGRIAEIFGPASCGKTALALQIVAHVQRSGGAATWIDAEHAFSATFSTQVGVNVSRLPVAMPDSAEQAGAIARRFLACGALDLVVIDSAAALVPELGSGAMIGSGGLQSRVLASKLAQASGGGRQKRSRCTDPQPDAHARGLRDWRGGDQRRRPEPEVIFGCTDRHGRKPAERCGSAL